MASVTSTPTVAVEQSAIQVRKQRRFRISERWLSAGFLTPSIFGGVHLRLRIYRLYLLGFNF